jgi:hypothetical protein
MNESLWYSVIIVIIIIITHTQRHTNAVFPDLRGKATLEWKKILIGEIITRCGETQSHVVSKIFNPSRT